MRTNYVLIDFENLQPESLGPLGHDHFKVMVFVGASQGYVEITGSNVAYPLPSNI